jgi:hypothetical protein
MASNDTDFEKPEIPELAEGNYDEWNWAVHFHLDWFGLRPFIIGTDTEPSATANPEEKLDYQRKKMMAYSILRASIDHYGWRLIERARLDYQLYDKTYNAKALWDAIHRVLQDDTLRVAHY